MITGGCDFEVIMRGFGEEFRVACSCGYDGPWYETRDGAIEDGNEHVGDES